MKHGEQYLPDHRCPQPSDHWYGTVEQLARDWNVDGVTRVDLVTTARVGKSNPARFAAIGFYLVYQEDPSTPSFYVIEAGEAQDNARQVFKSDRSWYGGTAFAQGWATYNPSRLSNPMNWYKAWLRGRKAPSEVGEWAPTFLEINAFHTTGAGYSYSGGMSRDPYVVVQAAFDEFTPTPRSPIGLGRMSIRCIAGGRAHDLGIKWGFHALNPKDEKDLGIARTYATRLCAAESYRFIQEKDPEPPAEGHKMKERVDSPCQEH
jgi:hypothetical protein